MKKKSKFGKFLIGSAAMAGVAAGAYYVYKNYIKEDDTDDFDDFYDDFDDEFIDDITSDDSDDESTREYVSININDSDNEFVDEDGSEDKKDSLMDVQEVTADEDFDDPVTEEDTISE